jgi:hypothetical protein
MKPRLEPSLTHRKGTLVSDHNSLGALCVLGGSFSEFDRFGQGFPCNRPATFSQLP